MNYLLNIDPRLHTTSEQIRDLQWKLPTIITVSGDITEESATTFRHEIEMAENIAIESNQSYIPIVIDSYGGDCYGFLSMMDAIKSCSVPVATVVEGKAMSAGAYLLSCGVEGQRYMAPSATVMIHSVISGMQGRNEHLQKQADESNRLTKKLFKIISKNCGKHETYFHDRYKENEHTDWFLDADEALKHNLVNHIGTPKIRINIKMEHTFSL